MCVIVINWCIGSPVSFISNAAIRTLASGLSNNLEPKDKEFGWNITMHGHIVRISEWALSHPHNNINLLGLDLICELKLKIFIDISEKNLIVSDKMNVS